MGVQNFAKYFENTSVNEILHSIQQIRKINKDADSERLFHQQFLSSSKRGLPRNERAEVRTDRLDMTKPKNWPEMLNAIRKARKIPDDTTAALSDLLTKYAAEDFEDKYFPVSDTPGHRSCDKIEAPYYDDIYSHLSLMVSARSLKNPRRYAKFRNVCYYFPFSIDSAIMLDIFDQLEKDIEKFPDMIEFFKQYFNDLKTYNSADFKIDTPLNADNIASISVNTLSLPDDLLDRSNFESRSNERSK
jgi:hypothetical protein